MDKVRVVDEVMLKQDFKNIYKEIGFAGMTQVLYELVFSAQLCLQVMQEEMAEENKNGQE